MKIYVNLFDRNNDVESKEVKCFQDAVDWYNDKLKDIPNEDLEWTYCIVDIVDDYDISVTVDITDVMDAIEEALTNDSK